MPNERQPPWSRIVVTAMVAVALAPGAASAQAADAGRAADSGTTRPLGARVIRPWMRLTWTTGAPDHRGDGAGFSGVGPDFVLSAGLQGALGPLRFSLRPEVIHNGNADHQVFTSGDPDRHPLASPFYHGAFSADLPSRPGYARRTTLAPGESGVWWSGARAFAGVLTSMPEWGPGGARALRPGNPAPTPTVPGEGLVLGRSAPGLPRLELAYAVRDPRWRHRTTLRWFAGTARESAWFDDDPDNDTRTVAGVRIEHERGDGLAVGAARTVMSVAGRGVAAAALQPFLRADGPALEIVSADLVFGASEGGTLAWLELARQAPISSVRRFMRFPTEGLAFRLGLRQRLARTSAAEWIGTVEAVRLDQSLTTTDAALTDLYTSATVIHGWTHRGQPLGSGIGPGGQSQSARIDRVGRVWRVGSFMERIRRNDDALLRDPAAVSDRHDVTLQLGLDAARRVGSYDVTLSLTGGRRLSYLFQGSSTVPGGPVDVGVMRAEIAISPSGVPRRIVGALPRP